MVPVILDLLAQLVVQPRRMAAADAFERGPRANGGAHQAGTDRRPAVGRQRPVADSLGAPRRRRSPGFGQAFGGVVDLVPRLQRSAELAPRLRVDLLVTLGQLVEGILEHAGLAQPAEQLADLAEIGVLVAVGLERWA